MNGSKHFAYKPCISRLIILDKELHIFNFRFGIFQTLSTPLLSVIRFLQMLTGPLFQVRISVYCKDGLYTVSCCQRHKWDESIKTMNSCNFHLISFGNAEIECGTKLSVKIHGGYEIKGDPGVLM